MAVDDKRAKAQDSAAPVLVSKRRKPPTSAPGINLYNVPILLQIRLSTPLPPRASLSHLQPLQVGCLDSTSEKQSLAVSGGQPTPRQQDQHASRAFPGHKRNLRERCSSQTNKPIRATCHRRTYTCKMLRGYKCTCKVLGWATNLTFYTHMHTLWPKSTLPQGHSYSRYSVIDSHTSETTKLEEQSSGDSGGQKAI